VFTPCWAERYERGSVLVTSNLPSRSGEQVFQGRLTGGRRGDMNRLCINKRDRELNPCRATGRKAAKRAKPEPGEVVRLGGRQSQGGGLAPLALARRCSCPRSLRPPGRPPPWAAREEPDGKGLNCPAQR